MTPGRLLDLDLPPLDSFALLGLLGLCVIFLCLVGGLFSSARRTASSCWGPTRRQFGMVSNGNGKGTAQLNRLLNDSLAAEGSAEPRDAQYGEWLGGWAWHWAL